MDVCENSSYVFTPNNTKTSALAWVKNVNAATYTVGLPPFLYRPFLLTPRYMRDGLTVSVGLSQSLTGIISSPAKELNFR